MKDVVHRKNGGREPQPLPGEGNQHGQSGHSLFTEPPQAEFCMKVGNSGEPPYRTPDGKGDWGGNLGSPAGICANPLEQPAGKQVGFDVSVGVANAAGDRRERAGRWAARRVRGGPPRQRPADAGLLG